MITMSLDKRRGRGRKPRICGPFLPRLVLTHSLIKLVGKVKERKKERKGQVGYPGLCLSVCLAEILLSSRTQASRTEL
jgi:hypothetical protein